MPNVEITVKEAFKLWKEGTIKLLDIRPEEERALAKIEGIPMVDEKLAQEMIDTWPKDTPIVFHCHHGIRSLGAVDYFLEKGFTNVKSLTGGIDAWSCEVDASVPRY